MPNDSALHAWAEAHKVKCPAIRLTTVENKGHGLVATKAFSNDEVVIKIPRSLCIRSDAIPLAGTGKPFNLDGLIDGSPLFKVALSILVALRGSPAWIDYSQFLPANIPSAACHWESLYDLVKGSSLEEAKEFDLSQLLEKAQAAVKHPSVAEVLPAVVSRVDGSEYSMESPLTTRPSLLYPQTLLRHSDV